MTHTIIGRKESVGVVTSLEVVILFHIHMGISIELTMVIARITKNYTTDTHKHALGLGPFITRVARYLVIDISTVNLLEVCPPTALINPMVLKHMGMVTTDNMGHFTIPPQPQYPPQPSQQQMPNPRSTLERYSAARAHRQDACVDRQDARLDRLEARMDRMENTLSNIQVALFVIQQHLVPQEFDYVYIADELHVTPSRPFSPQ